MSRNLSKLASPLPEPILRECVKVGLSGRYAKNQILFYEGHFPYGLYVIHQGVLRLRRARSRLDPIELGSGSIIGLNLIHNHQPYPGTAQVVDDLMVSFVDRLIVLKWIEKGEFESLRINLR